MRPWLRPWVLLLLGFLALAAIACEEAGPGPTPTPAAAPGFPVTVTDSQGNQVTFQEAPQRIVALAPSFVEILFAIGAGEALVAVDENTDFPPEATELLKVSGFLPNLEAVAAMEPDLVVLFFDPGDLQQSLERLGIPVLFLATTVSVQGLFEEIRLLGQVSGHSQDAEEVIASMEERIDAVTKKLADVQQGPRVFHELDPTLFSAAPESFVGDLYTILKAQNIAAGSPIAYPQLSQEEIIDKDPEVIILADEVAGETPETVKARPGWGNIAAVRTDRVHTVDPAIISRPGPRLVEGLELLARLLYPELFP